MAEAQKLALIMDPERIRDEFGKKDVMRHKIQQLKGAVFRNFNARKSKAVFHPSPPATRQTPIHQSPSTADSNLERTRVKNIQFRVSSCRTEGSPRRSHNSFNPRVGSSFAPKVFMHPHRTNAPQRQEEMAEKIQLIEKSKLKEQMSQKIWQPEHRDSQTLLRKSSLFLVSCLTTRYKDREVVGPHVGENTSAANQKRLTHFAEKAHSLTHYSQRFEYMESARQKLLQAKDPSQTHHPRLINRPSAILKPEPWDEPLSPTPF